MEERGISSVINRGEKHTHGGDKSLQPPAAPRSAADENEGGGGMLFVRRSVVLQLERGIAPHITAGVMYSIGRNVRRIAVKMSAYWWKEKKEEEREGEESDSAAPSSFAHMSPRGSGRRWAWWAGP